MVRMKDLKASAKLGNNTASRMLKERKREERDLRKLAKAAGVKIISARSGITSPPALPQPPADVPKKSGWATVGSSGSSGFAPVTSAEVSAPKSGGWSRVDPTSTSEPVPPPPADPPPPPPPAGPPPPLPVSSPTPPPPAPTARSKAAPVFHSSGWMNLTHQLEERAIVDTNNETDPSNAKDEDHEMQGPLLTPHYESPKRMVIDVDELYPPTPGTPAFGRHLPKTPAWRIHEAPSPSPHVGAAMRLPTMDHTSPITAALRGGAGIRGVGSSYGRGRGGPSNRGQPNRSWSPILDLTDSLAPGWSKAN